MRILIALLLSALCAYGSDKITASITVTNMTTNGMTFTVNSSVRTFTNNVVTSSSQVLTNNDVTGCGSKTNLFKQIGLNIFSQTTLIDTGTNTFQLVGTCSGALTVSASAGWASVSYSTQTCALATPVGVPFASYYPAVNSRSNVASQLVTDLNNYDTNSINQNAAIAKQLVGTNNTQTIANKTFTAPVIKGGTWDDSVGTLRLLTDSSGSFIYDQNGTVRFQADPSVMALWGTNGFEPARFYSDNSSVYIAYGTQPRFVASVLGEWLQDDIGQKRIWAGTNQTTLIDEHGLIRVFITDAGAKLYDQSGTVGFILDTNGVAINLALVVGGNSSVGGNHTVTSNSTVGGNLTVTGNASISGVTTNQTWTGTNTFSVGADIAFIRKAVSSLANGNNAAVPIGTNEFIEVSGPSGSFTINGIASGRDGKLITVLNQTGFQMTIANESGTDPTAANRIRTLGPGTDLIFTNAAVSFQYNANVSRWIVISHNP
jgi:hypothetical protein